MFLPVRVRKVKSTVSLYEAAIISERKISFQILLVRVTQLTSHMSTVYNLRIECSVVRGDGDGHSCQTS